MTESDWEDTEEIDAPYYEELGESEIEMWQEQWPHGDPYDIEYDVP